MGKKLQGAKLRAKKRAKAALDELQERQAEQSTSLSITTKTNDELFVIDTKGEMVPHHKRPPKRKKSETDAKGAFSGASESVQRKALAFIETHGAARVQQLAQEGRNALGHHNDETLSMKKRPNFDLWGSEQGSKQVSEQHRVDTQLAKRGDKGPDKCPDKRQKLQKTAFASQECRTASFLPTSPLPLIAQKEAGVGSTLAGVAPFHVETKAIQSSRRQQMATAVDVAKAGQSYHPDPVAYKKLIKEATAVEISREKAVRQMETPLSQGMSAETRALLVETSDEESDDDDDENESRGDGDCGSGLANAGDIPKRANKLTRAQRNKQKRLRIQQAIERKARTAKKFLKEIGEIPRYKKELKRKEMDKATKRSKNQTQDSLGKDVELRVAAQDPVHAPTVPVALSDELRSSLRTIKPKGNLATDRVLSLADRSQLTKKQMGHEAAKRRRVSQTRRRKSVKGKKNREAIGEDFEILG